MAVADFNGDGHLDIAACHDNLGCFLYFNDGKGHFGEGIPFDKPAAVPYSMIAADLNRDGRPEIIVGYVDAPGVIYFNDGLLGGSFVEKVQQHWWPQYSSRKFFWFNTGYFVIMIASVVAYEIRGGSWLILPLAWAIERLCNSFWHFWWMIHFREYSPGLVSSILIWMDSYFIVRHRPLGEAVAPRDLWCAVFIGLLAAAFLTFYISLVKGRTMRAQA